MFAEYRAYPNHELTEALFGGCVLDRGNTIDDDERRLQLLESEPKIDQEILQARGFGIAANHLQISALDVRLHAHPDLAVVPQEDGAGLFEAVIDDALTALRAGEGVQPGQQGLPAAGGTTRDDDRVAQPAAMRHLVETGHAARVTLDRARVRRLSCVERKDRQAFGRNGAGILTLVVRASPVLVDFN